MIKSIKFVIIFGLLLLQISLKAQIRIGISYLFSDMTMSNISLSANYKIKNRHLFKLGFKYHFNNDSSKFLFRYYYRNLYSENFLNKIGAEFEYRFYWGLKKRILPYAFYNFQYSRIGSKFKDTYWYFGSNIKEVKQVTIDPINFYENHVGIGTDIKLNPRLTYYLGVSGGLTLMTDRRDWDDLFIRNTATVGFQSSRSWEFSWLFNTGFLYNFSPSKKKADLKFKEKELKKKS